MSNKSLIGIVVPQDGFRGKQAEIWLKMTIFCKATSLKVYLYQNSTSGDTVIDSHVAYLIRETEHRWFTG